MTSPAGAWTDLGQGLRVRRSRAYRMNSVVLRGEHEALLVDPGVLPSELDDLAAQVGDVEPRSVTLVFTHAHWDHVLGRPWWPKARTAGHDKLAAELRRDAESISGEATRLATAHRERFDRAFAPFRPDLEVSGLHFRTLGAWRLVFRDAPGHCDSQLTIHLPERRVLIAADMLSDVEIPSLNRPAAVQRRTLETLMPLVEGGAIETLIPGHGSIAHGRDEVARRFARDLDYLARLEKEVGAARSRGLSSEQAALSIGAWEDVERDPEFPMLSYHRENVAFTYGGKPGS